MSDYPDEVEPVFESLQDDLVWLHGRWKLYRQLYGVSELRIELLNETASSFFHQLQNTLLDDVTLSIARMTEKKEVAGRENLVLAQLIDKLDKSEFSELRSRLEEQLDEIEKVCEPLRKNRHRLIAHRDLEAAISDSEDLPGISRAMIEDALEEIRTFMNAVQGYFADSETGYEHFVMKADAESLVVSLKKAVEYDDAVDEGLISRKRLRESRYWDA